MVRRYGAARLKGMRDCRRARNFARHDSLAWGLHAEALNAWYQSLERKPGFVWCFEDDVGFSGSLETLVDVGERDCSDADLVTGGYQTADPRRRVVARRPFDGVRRALRRRRLYFREHVQSFSMRLLDRPHVLSLQRVTWRKARPWCRRSRTPKVSCRGAAAARNALRPRRRVSQRAGSHHGVARGGSARTGSSTRSAGSDWFCVFVFSLRRPGGFTGKSAPSSRRGGERYTNISYTNKSLQRLDARSRLRARRPKTQPVGSHAGPSRNASSKRLRGMTSSMWQTQVSVREDVDARTWFRPAPPPAGRTPACRPARKRAGRGRRPLMPLRWPSASARRPTNARRRPGGPRAPRRRAAATAPNDSLS